MNKYTYSRKNLVYKIDVWLGEQPERMKEYFDVTFAKQLRKDLLSKKEPKEMWSHQMSGNRVVGFKCNMCGMVGKTLNNLEKHMLAKHLPKPESDKEKCLHDHLCCPGDIKTVRCAYCGKSMYHEPQEELVVIEPLKRLKSYKDKRGNIWIKDTGARKKLNSLIKAHNALVKEVKNK